MDVKQITVGGIYTLYSDEAAQKFQYVVAKVNIEGEKCWVFPCIYSKSQFSFFANDIECYWADEIEDKVGEIEGKILEDIKEIASGLIETHDRHLLDFCAKLSEKNNGSYGCGEISVAYDPVNGYVEVQ